MKCHEPLHLGFLHPIDLSISDHCLSK